MEWIVFWVVLNSYIVPCSQAGPTIDEFGVVHENNSYTLQLCWDHTKKNMSKEFDNMEAAQAFVARAIKECGDTRGLQIYTRSTCDQFEIKEMRPLPMGGAK